MIDRPHLFTETESAHLRADWQKFCQFLGNRTFDAGRRLVARIGIHKDAEIDDWYDHFSPLTTHYANLQTENISIPSELRRDADLAQLCFLVSTFVEDRALDGQIELDEDEARFAQAIRRRGWRILNRLLCGLNDEHIWILDLPRQYRASLHNTYTSLSTAGCWYGAVRRIAPARGYPGVMVPLALASAHGTPTNTLRRMKVAFDCLMLGLQWFDDLLDWREDLAHGDINLLLDALQFQGLDARTHPCNDLRGPNVGAALLSNGILDIAHDQSRRWLAIAAARQHALGCERLGSAIEEKSRIVSKRVQLERDRIINDVVMTVLSVSGTRNPLPKQEADALNGNLRRWLD